MSSRIKIDWNRRAKEIFGAPKPEHFTDFSHCCECFEHDEVLRSMDVDSIGLNELGNAAWDPMCFTSPEGVKYYLPALIRLTMDSVENLQTSYLDQFLVHLILDGEDNRLVIACDPEQRRLISDFLEYLIEKHATAIDEINCSWEILRAHEIWRDATGILDQPSKLQ